MSDSLYAIYIIISCYRGLRSRLTLLLKYSILGLDILYPFALYATATFTSIGVDEGYIATFCDDMSLAADVK